MLSNKSVDRSLEQLSCFGGESLAGILGVISREYIDQCKNLLEWSFLDAQEICNENYHGTRKKLMETQSRVISHVINRVYLAFEQLVLAETVEHNIAKTANKLEVATGVVFKKQQSLREAVMRLSMNAEVFLSSIAKRLDHLLLQSNVSKANNPFEPSIISEAFLEACDLYVNTDIVARTLVVEQFELQMLETLPICYRNAVDSLVDARILP